MEAGVYHEGEEVNVTLGSLMSEEMCANYKREEWKARCKVGWNSLISQHFYMHRFNELLSELDFGILSEFAYLHAREKLR